MEPLQGERKCLHCVQRAPLWIIEYVWTHRTIDVQQVVDPSTWPEGDSQPQSLEDSWRLRVASAQVFSIVKNRQMVHFERVIRFLEATYRLRPRLVPPIKHMKIIFGLKTMVVMWMLKEGRGMVDTLCKINQFFPSKLPQYQCSQHEISLMRKNHLDFKALSQALAMDKLRLEDYIKNLMEEQYGQHYAQKVEDRLLHYLHELETMLPGETYIDKILNKKGPVTDEEKLLLEVITSDTTTIAATLKKLLQCDAASCCQETSQSPKHGLKEMKTSQHSKSVPRVSSSEALLMSVEAKTALCRGGEEADQDLSEDSPLLLENDSVSDASRHGHNEDDEEEVERVTEESICYENMEFSQRNNECIQKGAFSLQFCSKHLRWVESILQECPDESEESLLQDDASLSPLLFHSSSSITSSQDLTPSDLVPCPEQQCPPLQASTLMHTAAHTCQQPNTEDKLSSGSHRSSNCASQKDAPPQPSSPRDNQLPALSPAVQLIDIASFRGICPTFKPQQASSDAQMSTSGPHQHSSGNDTIHQDIMKDSTNQPQTKAPINSPNTTHQIQVLSQDASTSTSCQPPTLQSFLKLPRTFRRACTATRHSQEPDGCNENPSAERLKMATLMCRTSPPLSDVSGPAAERASASTSQLESLSSVCTANQIPVPAESSQQVVTQSSIKHRPQTHSSRPSQCSTAVSSTSNSNCMTLRYNTSRVQTLKPRLSLSSQTMLLQSKLLQPCVSLTRLSAQECYHMTKGRSSARHVDDVVEGSSDDKGRRTEEEQDADSSFDVNFLYSSRSSSSHSEGLFDQDPDYKPWLKKKRLLEYEAAWL